MRSMTASAWVRSSFPLRKARWVNSPGPGLPGAGSEEGVQDQREDHGGAVALKLRRLLPGVAVGSPADKGQAGVKRLARLVQQGAVEELTVRRVRQGAGSLRAEDPGRCLGRAPGPDSRRIPTPPVPGGVATAAMRSDMEDLLSKNHFG